MILLDSCVLLWVASNPKALSQKAEAILEDQKEVLFVSAITAFEIGRKASRGLLTLPVALPEWFAGMLDRFQWQELPISAAIAARATLLPRIHNDPFDRLLVASAMEHGMSLLTPDAQIRRYPGVVTVW